MDTDNMSNISYRYTDEDLLESPESYQLSSYFGDIFLISYYDNRKKFIKLLGNAKISLHDIKNNPKKFDLLQSSFSNDDLTYETKSILQMLCIKLLSDNLSSNDKSMIDILLKKFETKKKLFQYYDSTFKNYSGKYDLLDNYMLFSFILLNLYKKNPHLKYLNCMLKINDTICSRCKNVENKNYKILFCYILQNEINIIDKLCNEKGLNSIE